MLFPDLYLYYEIKLVSLGYDKDFNLLLKLPVFIEPYIKKPMTLHQPETVPVPIKDKNIEANSYICLNSEKVCLAMTEGNYCSLTSAELSTYKHIGHKIFMNQHFGKT